MEGYNHNYATAILGLEQLPKARHSIGQKKTLYHQVGIDQVQGHVSWCTEPSSLQMMDAVLLLLVDCFKGISRRVGVV